MADKVSSFRTLNIIDEYSREYLAIRVDRKLNSGNVIDALSDLFILRGIPSFIRSDNGPEFVAQAGQDWIKAVGVKTAYIEPRSPWEKGYCESFNVRLRSSRQHAMHAPAGQWKTLQHQKTTQCTELSPASARSHRSNGLKTDHALTLKLDHSSGADQTCCDSF